MRFIIIAAGLSLVSAAALPQDIFNDFSGNSDLETNSDPQGLGPDSGPTTDDIPVNEIPSDPDSNLDDGGLDDLEIAQDSNLPTSGEFDRAEGEACVAAMIEELPNEKAGVDCACFCGGLSCINMMVDQQTTLDFRADSRIPASCQAKFDEGDSSQTGPESFNPESNSPLTSSGGSELDTLSVDSRANQLSNNPTPGGSTNTDERMSEGEEFLRQNEQFNSQEEQVLRDSIINT